LLAALQQRAEAFPQGGIGDLARVRAEQLDERRGAFGSFLCRVVHIVRAVLGSTALSPSSTNWMTPCLSMMMLARRSLGILQNLRPGEE